MTARFLLKKAAAGAACLVASAAVASCFTGSDGLVPPTTSFYFPTAVLVSPGRTTLYVANSDFDLQYNGGTIQALDLAEMRAVAGRVAQAIEDGADESDVCAEVDSTPNVNNTQFPGVCEPIAIEPFVRAFATVGAFSSGLTLLARNDGEPGARLFASVRGDPSLTFFDVVDDRDPESLSSPCDGDFCLECAAEGDERRCGRPHRIGENIFTSQRGLLLPTEPTSVASATGNATDPLVLAHQTEATASLVVNSWPQDGSQTPFASTPSLEFLLEGLDEAPTFVAHIPQPGFVDASDIEYRPGFAVTHRADATLTVLRFFDDAGGAPPRPFLVRADATAITISNDNTDSRGIAFDTTDRDKCESSCAADDLVCFEECLDEDVGVYIASRSPAALLIGALETSVNVEDGVPTSLDERISLDESVPLPLGPSTVAVGKVVGASGELETRIFVVCFDSRFVVIYDPLTRGIETQIRTGRGPFGLAFDTSSPDADEPFSFLYVTQFTDSYLSVVDLDTRRDTYAERPLVNFGPPVAPREEQ